MAHDVKIFWKIFKLEVLPSFNGLTYPVKRVCYEVSALVELEDDGEIASLMGEAVLDDPNEKNFIPYFDLDEETILKWVKESIGTQTARELEAEVTQNVLKIVKPELLEMELPWEMKEKDKVVTFKKKKVNV